MFIRLAIAGLLLTGCGSTYLVDPDVDYQDEPAYLATGEPALNVGFYREQLYRPLVAGGDCPVVWGFQGGTWVMPTLRIVGIDVRPNVTCTLTMDDGELVGAIDQEQPFTLAPDGWLEVQALPIGVNHAPPNAAAPIDDLYGRDANFTCTVTDNEDRSASASIAVVVTSR